MLTHHMRSMVFELLVSAVIVVVATNCSDSTGPDSDDSNNNNNHFTDVPSIPKPSTPGGETGAYSDTVTVISPLATNFRPIVTAMYANWAMQSRCGTRLCGLAFSQWSYTSWTHLVGMQSMWSNEVELTVAGCSDKLGLNPAPVSLAGHLPWDRILLFEEGEILPVQSGEGEVFTAWDSGCDRLIQEIIQYQINYTCGAPLTNSPYLRRDRFWVRRPLEGGVGNFMLLTGNTQGEISSTYTSGSSTTETEEFGRTVTASAGLSLGALSLGAEVSISQTFSTSVTMSEESSESFTKTVFGDDGKIVHFQVWELVERYTITDAEGNPFTDPNYEFAYEELHIHGAAVALEATKFDG